MPTRRMLRCSSAAAGSATARPRQQTGQTARGARRSWRDGRRHRRCSEDPQAGMSGHQPTRAPARPSIANPRGYFRSRRAGRAGAVYNPTHDLCPQPGARPARDQQPGQHAGGHHRLFLFPGDGSQLLGRDAARLDRDRVLRPDLRGPDRKRAWLTARWLGRSTGPAWATRSPSGHARWSAGARCSSPTCWPGSRFFGWTMAGLIWGFALPLVMHHFSLDGRAAPALRDHRDRGQRDLHLHLLRQRVRIWRRRLPVFFPTAT